MLKKFKLSTRVLLLGVTIVVCFSLVFAWIIPKMRKSLYDAKYLKTKELVESTGVSWTIM